MKIRYEEQKKNSSLLDYMVEKNNKQIQYDEMKAQKPKTLGYINGQPLNKELHSFLLLQGAEEYKK